MITLTEAVAPDKAIYRTLGNTEKRFYPNDDEEYKETLIGGEDYLVYIELPVDGYKENYLFVGPDNGVTVKVLNRNTLRFTVNTSFYMGNENVDNRANFAIDKMRIILQKVTDPAVKYYSDIKVNSNENQQIIILGN